MSRYDTKGSGKGLCIHIRQNKELQVIPKKKMAKKLPKNSKNRSFLSYFTLLRQIATHETFKNDRYICLLRIQLIFGKVTKKNGLKGLLSAQKRQKMVKIDFIAQFCLMVSCETMINCGNICLNSGDEPFGSPMRFKT